MSEGAVDKPTVLLVDDEEENLLVLSTLLEGEFRVLLAETAARALELLDLEAVDVLITDQRMPGASGVELLRRARRQHPEVVRMALTAYTDVELVLDAINEGAVYQYIIKPWSVDQMRLTIRRAVEWGRLQRDHGALAAELNEANKLLRASNEELRARNEELLRTREHLIAGEKLAAVGRFAAEMVHEMNHHLQLSELLLADLQGLISDQRAEQRLGQCREQMWHLAEIARDIQEFAGGAAPTMRLRQTDPVELARQIVVMCCRHPRYRSFEVVIEADEIGDCLLDRSKLMHLIANLLRNAFAVTPAGAPVLLRLRREGQQLLIEVEDRGPGVPSDQREVIFEPFHTTKGAEGNGLGLTICRWVAQVHGGRIEVRSGRAGGALFVVTIPLRDRAETSDQRGAE